MKAMIFAAGKGTRLKPLTDTTPKALVKVNGVPMLERVIRKLIQAGVDEIIINTHHFAHQITEFLRTKNNFKIRIEISHEKDGLLDTGGGLKKASWFFSGDQPFFLYNVDILSNIDLQKMLRYHQESHALATLAVRKRDSGRYFLFKTENQQLCGWENIKTKQIINYAPLEKSKKYAFSGIHLLNPDLFRWMPAEKSFSIIDTYLNLCNNQTIKAYLHPQDFWFDIGTTEKLMNAESFLKNHFLNNQ
ncbi:MAG: nucleotidyltransferase family protein [Bacteroidales bacterium]|jgi:NDP-sugar pyrophosphorylase family protein|nr:nucleotidyltransferase family protein [Bacteroidales bacterium]